MIRERDKVIEHIARKMAEDDLSGFKIQLGNAFENMINQNWKMYIRKAGIAYNAFIEYDETRCYGT